MKLPRFISEDNIGPLMFIVGWLLWMIGVYAVLGILCYFRIGGFKM